MNRSTLYSRAAALGSCFRCCAEPRLLPLFVGVALLTPLRSLRAAAPEVEIAQHEPALDGLVRRLVFELTSAGYSVTRSAAERQSPCEDGGDDPGPVTAEHAWIRLEFDPNLQASVRAHLCYQPALTYRDQVLASASQPELARFTITIAEALNGLRANAARTRAPLQQAARLPPAPPAPAPPAPTSASSVALTQTLVRDAQQGETLAGATFQAALAVASRSSLVIDSFFTLVPRRLTNDQVQLSSRAAWMRVGIRQYFDIGAVKLSSSLAAGPAITWATATAMAPRVGTAAVTWGALIGLGAAAEFPSDSAVFFLASAEAASLLRNVRFQLGTERSEPFGRLLLEGSVGLGFRWALSGLRSRVPPTR